MAAPRNRKHILVEQSPSSERYRPHPPNGRTKKPAAPDSRPDHGQALRAALEAATRDALQRRVDAGLQVHGATPGLYVEFESRAGISLNLKSLEAPAQGIELVAVPHPAEGKKEAIVERATVFVPTHKLDHFMKRFDAYAKTTPKQPKEQRHEDMLDRVAALKLATLRGLWTDRPSEYPDEAERIWWEVWLRRHDGNELSRIAEFSLLANLLLSDRRLQFDDRIVTLIRATPKELSASLDVLNDVAEVRRAKEAPSFFTKMRREEQAQWTEELLQRTLPMPSDAPSVCVLDTGVNRGHPLLAKWMADTDCHSYLPSWGAHDHDGHGTEMAGLALYGHLTPHLASSLNVSLTHGLESVKILPPTGSNAPELYGAITAEAAGRVEIQAPHRRRCFCMAVTTDGRDRGQPTSWSSAVDALAAGRMFDPSSKGLVYLGDDSAPARRLFIISAGNVDQSALSADHLDYSDASCVQDPAQAWNALTVGAFTDRSRPFDDQWASWQPLAARGELSPWSVTGVTFPQGWPNKPDVVFEGGNVLRDGSGAFEFEHSDLGLLTTHAAFADKQLFVTTWATSAAAAQAAHMAGAIASEYPALWPEAVRALIVHAAEWTPAMRVAFGRAPLKTARSKLVRRYGFGVPDLTRALRSANDALTLIAQATIQPFVAKQGKPNERQMGQIHFFELPWPRDELLALGGTEVKLRVTLSYFIEPNPARLGWKQRHRYASHGLRFEVKGATESMSDFRKRLNKRALDEEEGRPSAGNDSAEWYLGEQARSRGSLHSDMMLQIDAADLAERGVVAVYPVTGWWKEQPKRDRSHLGARYALVVSIETPAVETDIWSPVAIQAGLEVAHETAVESFSP